MELCRELLRSALTGRLSVSPRDREGRTPLHAACREGHADVVSDLLEVGPRRKGPRG